MMKQGQKLTKKKKIEIATKICEKYATDEFTLADCCTAYGVKSPVTFYAWCKEYEEIERIHEKAKDDAAQVFDLRIKTKARKAFEQRIEGFYIDTEETIYENDENGKPRIKMRKLGKKYYPPSDTLIQVALYNKDSENFQDKRNVELGMKEGDVIKIDWSK